MPPTLTAPMPPSKAGKPRREDKAMKIDRVLAEKAQIIARSKGMSAAEYLSELLRPLIDRDFPKAIQKFTDT